MNRPVLLAMNNPISSDPGHALYPHPPGCAGARLYDMLRVASEVVGLHVSPRHYLARFDRRNLLSAPVWVMADARAAAASLVPQLSQRAVVVLGVEVLRALGLDRRPWGEWGRADYGVLAGGAVFNYCLLPHPSGRSLAYNSPDMRDLAGRTLLSLYHAALPREAIT